jgi:hypothetical protein
MIITNKHLRRRVFLRGLGTTLALPFLDAMVPAFAAPKLGASKPAVRLGFIYVPNGIISAGWMPKGEGANFEFNSTMKSLEPLREHTLVLSGLAQIQGRSYGDGAGDHARAGASWLTGVHPKKTEGADLRAGISADQVAARTGRGSSQSRGGMRFGLQLRLHQHDFLAQSDVAESGGSQPAGSV